MDKEITQNESNQQSNQSVELSTNKITGLVTRLRDRSRRLRRNAGYIILGIIILLTVGIGIFVAAGEIARRESELAEIGAIWRHTDQLSLENTTQLEARCLASIKIPDHIAS